MKQTKNLVRRTWFFQISFSEIMYRSTGTAFYKTIFSLNSYFRNFCWMIRTQPIPLFKLFLLYSFQWHFFQKFSKFLLFQGLQTRSQDLFALVRAMVAVEEEIEKDREVLQSILSQSATGCHDQFKSKRRNWSFSEPWPGSGNDAAAVSASSHKDCHTDYFRQQLH